jgi:hypothetical protein
MLSDREPLPAGCSWLRTSVAVAFDAIKVRWVDLALTQPVSYAPSSNFSAVQ